MIQPKHPSTDWMDLGVTTLIFLIPTSMLSAAIAASFTHIKDWALNHAPPNTHEWQGWAFAVIVELIPIFGVLVMWKLRKVEHKNQTIPRVLLAAGFIFSMAGQVAYAGGVEAGLSRLIVAAGPSIAGLGLTEVLLWLVRAFIEGDKAPAPPAPAVVPPPPMTLPAQPLAAVPPAVPQDIEPEQRPVSPWTDPPRTYVPKPIVPQDTSARVPSVSPGGQGDKAQATGTVPPSVSPWAGGEDMGGQDLPEHQDTNTVSPTLSGGHVPQDTPEEDTDPEGDSARGDRGTAGLDPIDLETWEQAQNGLSKKELATKYGVSEKTIQRRLGKVRSVIASTATEEEHSNA